MTRQPFARAFAGVLTGVLALMMLFAVSAGTAQAQETERYPGPFGTEPSTFDMGDNVDNAVGDGGLFISPDITLDGTEGADTTTVGGTGGGDSTSPGLAVTGIDSEPAVAFAFALMAVGGTSVVVARRRLRTLEAR